MTKADLLIKIETLKDSCDDSDEQQAIKAVLCCLLGAATVGQEMALMVHCCAFSEWQIRQLTASRN